MELKPLTLKIRKDIWFAWKAQAAAEETTMSELAERLVSEYMTKKKPAKFRLDILSDPEQMKRYLDASRPKGGKS